MNEIIQAIDTARSINPGDPVHLMAVEICTLRRDNPGSMVTSQTGVGMEAWRAVIVESLLTMQIGTHVAMRSIGASFGG